MESTVQSHMPSQLKSAMKENNIILKKENRRMMALSGTNGYGPQKPEFNVDITSSQVVDGSSLQLRGYIKTTGNYTETLKFNGSAYSLVEQITIDYNGQPIIQLNQDADYLAQMNRTLNESTDERKIQNYMSLQGVDIKPSTGKHYFNLDLSKYGSKLNYFLLTDEVATLKVKIRFNTDRARLFHGPEDGTNTVDGFELGDLQLAADFMSLKNKVYKSFMSRAQGNEGINMSTHSFITQRTKLQAGNTNHNINGSFQYKNVVSIFYLPVNTTLEENAAKISNYDIIASLSYQNGTNLSIAGQLPQNQRINFNGEVYVNQNGTEGMSSPPVHLQSVINAVKKYPDSNNLGSELINKYSINKYQITGASFVRGNDNLKEITNSGANGFISRGILENQFTTTATQDDKTILQVGVVTTVVSIKDGQVAVDR